PVHRFPFSGLSCSAGILPVAVPVPQPHQSQIRYPCPPGPSAITTNSPRLPAWHSASPPLGKGQVWSWGSAANRSTVVKPCQERCGGVVPAGCTLVLATKPNSGTMYLVRPPRAATPHDRHTLSKGSLDSS